MDVYSEPEQLKGGLLCMAMLITRLLQLQAGSVCPMTFKV